MRVGGVAPAHPRTGRGAAHCASSSYGQAVPDVPAVQTERLVLRAWRDDDLDAFAALNADAEVMRYFPSTLSRNESDAFVERARSVWTERGFGWWAVEVTNGPSFVGFIGLSLATFEAPFTPAVEIGWRLAKAAWGCGYATEGAKATLGFAFDVHGIDELVSFTSVENRRSRDVMERLGMRRDANEDFDHPSLPTGHPLRHHVLYRLRRPGAMSD